MHLQFCCAMQSLRASALLLLLTCLWPSGASLVMWRYLQAQVLESSSLVRESSSQRVG